MALTCYVYYKVRPGAETLARELALAMLAAVERELGIAGRLLRRRDDPATWMEVYEGAADDGRIEACLASGAERLEFTQVLQAGTARRMEMFRPL